MDLQIASVIRSMALAGPVSSPSLLRRLMVCGLALPFLMSPLSAEPESKGNEVRVTISANANPQFLKTRKKGQEAKRERTYILAEGQFFPGRDEDESLRKVQFRQLTLPIAYGLSEKGYTPAKEQEKADLLVIVHWGITIPAKYDKIVEENILQDAQDALAELSASDPLVNDAGRLNNLATMQENINAGVDRQIYANARILGYSGELRKAQDRLDLQGRHDEVPDIAKQLLEERYFIVVSAWDNQSIRADGERKLLWITRANLPAQGADFPKAASTLIRVGYQYFGQDLPELKDIWTHLGS